MEEIINNHISFGYWKFSDEERKQLDNVRSGKIAIADYELPNYDDNHDYFFNYDDNQKSKDNIDWQGYSVYKEQIDKLDVNNPTVKNKIIYGLNQSKDGTEGNALRNFHTASLGDRYFASNIIGTNYEGVLLSDVIKSIVDSSSEETMDKWKAFNDEEKLDDKTSFIEEIKFVKKQSSDWEYFTFVAFSGDAVKVITEFLKSKTVKDFLQAEKLIPIVCKLYHYSSEFRVPKEEKKYIMINQVAMLDDYLQNNVYNKPADENMKFIKVNVKREQGKLHFS